MNTLRKFVVIFIIVGTAAAFPACWPGLNRIDYINNGLSSATVTSLGPSAVRTYINYPGLDVPCIGGLPYAPLWPYALPATRNVVVQNFPQPASNKVVVNNVRAC